MAKSSKVPPSPDPGAGFNSPAKKNMNSSNLKNISGEPMPAKSTPKSSGKGPSKIPQTMGKAARLPR